MVNGVNNGEHIPEDMRKINRNDLHNAAGGCNHMDHNICCACGCDCSAEMLRTYSRKWPVDKGGDGKWHFFCIDCIRTLGLA